jgi:hypothetical protein
MADCAFRLSPRGGFKEKSIGGGTSQAKCQERESIAAAFQRSGDNISGTDDAAELLGMNPSK